MPMTNENMGVPVPDNPKVNLKLTEAQVQAVAAKAKELEKEEDPLAGVKDKFEDQVAAEIAATQGLQAKAEIAYQDKPIAELIEEDAYDFSIPITAGLSYNPDALKIKLKDKTYVARWCNRNDVRQAQLVSQGFRTLQASEVENVENLDMFIDAQGHLVYSDLVAMKIKKDVYYGGLRRAYEKSLIATNAKKAAQAGASKATTDLVSSLKPGEREYLDRHQKTHQPVYNPNIGV